MLCKNKISGVLQLMTCLCSISRFINQHHLTCRLLLLNHKYKYAEISSKQHSANRTWTFGGKHLTQDFYHQVFHSKNCETYDYIVDKSLFIKV